MKQLSIDEKLEICKNTRKKALESLTNVLIEVLKSKEEISEGQFRDLWHQYLYKNNSLFENGWYLPPKYGLGVIFAKDNDGNESRLNHSNLRQMQASYDINLDRKNGIIYLYASPIDKESGIIGDIALTLYFGNDSTIIKHLKTCFDINYEIFDKIKVGMSFSQIHKFANDLIYQKGLTNDIECITDPNGKKVIGHTIPFSNEKMTDAEIQIYSTNEFEKINEMISKKRKYLKNEEDLIVNNGMAFTIEPREKQKKNSLIPMVSYHNIALIHEDGKKELLSGYEEIFRLAKMDYMMEAK
jgi:methionine aminopeptidase